MLRKSIFWIVVCLGPLGLCLYLSLSGTVLILADNSGQEGELTTVIVSGRSVERSEPRMVDGLGYISFTPQLSGAARLICYPAVGADIHSQSLATALPLGAVASGDFHAFYIRLNGCSGMTLVKHLSL